MGSALMSPLGSSHSSPLRSSLRSALMVLFMVILGLTSLAAIEITQTDEAHAASYITKKGFPKSYRTRLKKLHKLHPSWKFTPVITGLDWDDAADKMTENPRVNTVWHLYTPAYKSVAEGRYNYLEDTYEGGSYPAASEKAVKYFMDPRNFLTERNIFLFEDRKYHSYQRLSIVKKALKRNKVLYKNAKVFVKAGKKYKVSPLYIAAKSFSELGTSTFMMNGHEFTYNGVKYKKCYNAYNIGASDTMGAVGGLIYANGGKVKKDYAVGKDTSYGRKWSTPGKAIRGGAKFLCSSYIKNNQSTCYTEHFNVMNGLSKVGTHVYMTSLNGGISMAGQVSEKYGDYGIYDKALRFYIPVYKNMPSKPCGRPSASEKKDNNYYIKKLIVKYTTGSGDDAETKEKTFIKASKLSYKTSFKLAVPEDTEKIKISALAASTRNPNLTGTGEFELEKGANTFKVKCKASAGPSRTYTIKITRG